VAWTTPEMPTALPTRVARAEPWLSVRCVNRWANFFPILHIRPMYRHMPPTQRERLGAFVEVAAAFAERVDPDWGPSYTLRARCIEGPKYKLARLSTP
jgi:hypothetical protein